MRFLKKVKKLEDEQFTTDLINTIENNENVLNEKEKGITKNKLHIAKAVVEILNLNISYQKKRKNKEKNNNKIQKVLDNYDDCF